MMPCDFFKCPDHSYNKQKNIKFMNSSWEIFSQKKQIAALKI